MDSLFAIGTFGIVSAYVIELLKQTPFVPFLRADTKTLNRWFGVFIAIAVSLGVSAHYDGASGSLLISGLNSDALMHNGLHALAQWSVQQFTYDAAISQQTTLQRLARAMERLVMLPPEPHV